MATLRLVSILDAHDFLVLVLKLVLILQSTGQLSQLALILLDLVLNALQVALSDAILRRVLGRARALLDKIWTNERSHRSLFKWRLLVKVWRAGSILVHAVAIYALSRWMVISIETLRLLSFQML